MAKRKAAKGKPKRLAGKSKALGTSKRKPAKASGKSKSAVGKSAAKKQEPESKKQEPESKKQEPESKKQERRDLKVWTGRKAAADEDDIPQVLKRKRNRLKGRMVRRTITAKWARDALGPIEPGCEIYCLTMGKFSLIEVMEWCLEHTGPAAVTVSTWTASGADISVANRMLVDGRVTSLRFLVDYSFPSRQPAFCAALRERFGDDAVRMTSNHAKFVLMTNDLWNLVIRTSMNLNECRRTENLEISDDPEMAGWLRDVVDLVFERQGETFEKRPFDFVKGFGDEWADDERVEVGDGGGFFGDGPTDVDLRRVGAHRRS